ncbi:hypothetical protein Tco_0711829 [Tanacetum coccineum]
MEEVSLYFVHERKVKENGLMMMLDHIMMYFRRNLSLHIHKKTHTSRSKDVKEYPELLHYPPIIENSDLSCILKKAETSGPGRFVLSFSTLVVKHSSLNGMIDISKYELPAWGTNDIETLLFADMNGTRFPDYADNSVVADGLCQYVFRSLVYIGKGT